MELCRDFNFQNVIFEGDAKAIIMVVKSEGQRFCPFKYGHLIEDNRKVLNNKCEWSLQFAYRDRNIVAHTLTKAALCIDEVRVWIEEVLDFIVNSLSKDKNCMVGVHI